MNKSKKIIFSSVIFLVGIVAFTGIIYASNVVTNSNLVFVNTPENLALPVDSRKVIMTLPNGNSRIITRTQLTRQIAGLTAQQAMLATRIALLQSELASIPNK